MTLIILESSDINYFTGNAENNGRSSNDNNNKIRENIIYSMPYIDNDYFDDPIYGSQWLKLKTDFDNKIRSICPTYHSYTIKHKAGRGHNYDYLITFFDVDKQKITEEKLEFKFNASSIDEAPQFVSPMKPSQYLSNPFEEYYYDNYLTPLLQEFVLPIPDKELYLKSIHNNKPKCMEEAQLLYYQGCKEGCKESSKFTGTEQAIKFYQKCKESSRECIKNFINLTELNSEKLTEYLITSQDKKIYLLYKNNEFHIQTTNSDDYTIVSYSKNPERSRYEAVTKSGKKMKILLRWKNGNGIAYPAFQIS
jgi:hypothetical protein